VITTTAAERFLNNSVVDIGRGYALTRRLWSGRSCAVSGGTVAAGKIQFGG